MRCCSACGERHTTQELLQQAEASLAAGDSAGAERLLREALDDAPNDPRIYIGLARADLAAGHAAAAEGSLDRAMQLGAPKEEVVAELARVLVAKGEPQRVLDLVGDVGQWPQPRRLSLALSKGEAELALPGYDPRELTQSFIDVFRLRSTAQADGAVADLAWFDRHTAELRSKQAAVEGGYQHFACTRDAPATSKPGDVGGTPSGPSCPQGRSEGTASASGRAWPWRVRILRMVTSRRSGKDGAPTGIRTPV